MMIKSGKIHKANKKLLNAKGKNMVKGKGKDNKKKRKQVGSASSSGIFTIELFSFPNNNSTYLWHCHLAHINKKRIKQLQQDGLLKSTDDESFDKCESCLSGKITKKPFPHSNERAKDLLGIIHT
ncbi:retrotransposon protein, putative, ty1-copia subclass, partial [Tanacetum coccineum]